MELDAKLKICLFQSCKKVTLTDNSGLYNSETNLNGWSNTEVTGNIETSAVVSASVSFTKLGSTTPNYTFNVTDLYPDEATPEFKLEDFEWSGGDGIWTVVYTGDLGADTWNDYTTTILITCEAECCIKSLFTKYFQTGNTELRDKAMFLTGELKSIQANFDCNNTTDAEKMLETLAKICEIALQENDCNSCGG